MTTDEMIANLQSLLGKIGTVLDSEILVELRLAQTQVERGPTLPWFLIKDKKADTVVGEPRLAVPIDFLREAEYSALAILNTDNEFVILDKADLDDLREAYAGENQGLPEDYGLLGGQFWLFPVPDAIYTVKMQYYAQDAQLATGDSGNLWSTYYPDLLMGLAGVNLCLHLRALNIMPRFEQMVTVARQQMIADETAREAANRQVVFSRHL